MRIIKNFTFEVLDCKVHWTIFFNFYDVLVIGIWFFYYIIFYVLTVHCAIHNLLMWLIHYDFGCRLRHLRVKAIHILFAIIVLLHIIYESLISISIIIHNSNNSSTNTIPIPNYTLSRNFFIIKRFEIFFPNRI